MMNTSRDVPLFLAVFIQLIKHDDLHKMMYTRNSQANCHF